MNVANLNIKKEAPSEFLNYLQLLWFRKRLVLIITLLVSLFGISWLGVQPPVYRSTAGLLIGFPTAGTLVADIDAAQAAPDRIANEIEILRSRELVFEVIKRFQLQVYNEFDPSQAVKFRGIQGVLAWVSELASSILPTEGSRNKGAGDLEETAGAKLAAATDIFLQKLSLQRAANSDVVNISFASYDPELAARIANALAEAYIAAQLQAKIDESQTESAQFAEQFRVLKNQLTASQRAEEFYRNTLGVAEMDLVEQLDQELSDLNSQIIIARSQKADALERLNLIESASSQDARLQDIASRLAAFPRLEILLEQQASLARAASELAESGDARQQERLQVEAEIAENNSALRSEFSKITLRLQNEAAEASQRVDALEAVLTSTALESSKLQSRLLSLRALQEETAINQMKLEAFVNRFKDSSFSPTIFTPDSRLISPAARSQERLYPGRSGKIALVVLAGFAIGLLWILLVQLRNPGLLSPEHVEQVLGNRTIGVIPIVPGNKEAHEYVIENPDSDYTNAVKALKITLDLSDMENKVKVIQLVSSIPNEGKTSLAVSLAQAVTGFGQKVLLVNSDLRSTSIHDKLGLPPKSPGFTDLMLSNDSELTEFVMTDVLGGFHYLPAGTATYANADVVFASPRMDTIVGMMRSQYDFVIFDSPPLQVNTDAVPLSKHVDKSLFVIRWNKTSKKKASSAIQKLQAGNVELAGIVLEQVNMQRYGNIAYSDYGYIYNQRI